MNCIDERNFEIPTPVNTSITYLIFFISNKLNLIASSIPGYHIVNDDLKIKIFKFINSKSGYLKHDINLLKFKKKFFQQNQLTSTLFL